MQTVSYFSFDSRESESLNERLSVDLYNDHQFASQLHSCF